MLEKINDNAYKIDFRCEYNVSTTFNVFDLSPFTAYDEDLGLTTNFSQEAARE